MADKTKDRARMVNLLLSWLWKFATSVKIEVVCLAGPKCRASLHTEPQLAHVVAQKDSQVDRATINEFTTPRRLYFDDKNW